MRISLKDDELEAPCSIGPGQSNCRIGKGHDAFAATREAHGLAGGGFHRNSIDVDLGDFGDARAHGVAVWSNARRFAHDRYVKMRDPAAPRLHAINRKSEETVG